MLGDDVVYAEAGDLAFKPARPVAHVLERTATTPCRILEIISPGGFEHFFEEMGEQVATHGFDPERQAALAESYGLEAKPESIPEICKEHGLDHPLLNMAGGG